MKKKIFKLFSIVTVLALMLMAVPMQSVHAVSATVTRWTFESPNTPTSATAATYPNNIAPAVGTGNAGGAHTSASTAWSTPAGNGSTFSFSSNNWAVNDYYQFAVSTSNFTDIQVSWDQTRSSTGPATFKLAYSTDGTTFTDFGSPYSISVVTWSTTTPVSTSSFAFDLTAVTALNNQATVYFRLINTVAPGGSGGTNRVDNFTVSGAGSTPPSGVGASNPSTLFAGDAALLTVAVTPGTNPTSTGLAVSCDITAIGGSASQTFYDDATNGDATAGDNTFSYSATVVNGTTGGAKSLSCTITDTQARTGNATISLTVTSILPIGTVNGVVSDTENATIHRSPYAPASGNGAGSTTVVVQGVIYERTFQPIANSSNFYKGFFIQNTSATADGDPHTSDGLFVFMNTNTTIPGPSGAYTPQVGDEVVISGSISEFFNMTELQSPNLSLIRVVRSGVDINAEVAPMDANPPANLADANRYWERLQSMRVQAPADSIVLGGRNVFSPADAEIWLARPDSTIALRTDPYIRRAFRDAHPLDDNYDANNWDGNGYRMLIGSWGIKFAAGDAQALMDPARTFDKLSASVAGGLNYTFSKYRIEISAQPTFTEGVDPTANHAPEAPDRATEYSIVDYNVENLYDYRDNPFSGCDFTGNSGCPATAPFISAVSPPYDYVPASDAVYQARLTDIATQIIDVLHAPDILMMQEVENQDICTVSSGALVCGTTDNADGKPDDLQELALKIASLGGPSYDAAFDRDSSDLRGIAPSFMYRTGRVQLLPPNGDPILDGSPAIDGYTAVSYDGDTSNPKTLNAVYTGTGACETSYVFPRAPDIGLFRVYANAVGDANYRDVYVIDNHFKSNPDTCANHRKEQAKYNAALVAYLQSVKPNANIVLGGDLNVYAHPDDTTPKTDQLAALYASNLGLKNLYEVELERAPEAAYSYVFLGMAQTIDQIFVNQSMLGHLSDVRTAHINSDFPADYTGDVARGTSDHDPTAARFFFNLAPVAANDSYSVTEDTGLTASAPGVLANDSDSEGDSLTAGLVSGPSHGALTLNADGSFSYTPASNYNGPDSFTYQAKDPYNVLSNVATVSITVNAVNDAPVCASPQSASTGEDTALNASVVCTDVDNDMLTYSSVSNPSHGTLTLNNDGTFAYTPAANYNGSDSFTFKTNDGTADSNVATFNITITAVNDAPVAVNDSYSTNEDTPLNVAASGVLGNDTDVDGNSLTAVVVTGPAHGSLTLNSDGSFSYTPAANYHGPDSFTYKANDGTTDSNVATVTLTVNSVNDAPVATPDSVTTNKNTSIAIFALANDFDVDGDTLTVAGFTQPAHGTVAYSTKNRNFRYTPTNGFKGTDSFTYTINDGHGGTATTTVTIVVK